MPSIPIFAQLIREDIAPIIENIHCYEFVGGEARTMAIQLLNSYNKKANFVPTGWKTLVVLPTADQYNPMYFVGTPDATDPSVFYVDLPVESTVELISGRLTVKMINVADVNAATIVSSFVPTSYSSSNGTIAVPDAVDLDNVCPGQLFEDAAANRFLIIGVIDILGAKAIILQESLTVNLGIAAFFTGIPAGCTTSVTITADNTGTIGNSVILTGDGTSALNLLISNYNTANPLNMIALTTGDGTQIPNNAVAIDLAGGVGCEVLQSTGTLSSFRDNVFVRAKLRQ